MDHAEHANKSVGKINNNRKFDFKSSYIKFKPDDDLESTNEWFAECREIYAFIEFID